MCRLLAYLGPAVTLEELLYAPDHSLLEQSYAPRYQTHGRLNADGFGVGWYERGRRTEPARYRTERPFWTDVSFRSMAGLITSEAMLASVRSATPGLAVHEANTAPFMSNVWLFAHNGEVAGFRDGIGERLRRTVSEMRAASIEGSTDSEVMFAMTLDRLDAGASPGESLSDVARTIDALSGGRLNMILHDGRQIAATCAGNSMFTLERADAVIVASEPYDDGEGWHQVPDGSVLEVANGTLSLNHIHEGAVN